VKPNASDDLTVELRREGSIQIATLRGSAGTETGEDLQRRLIAAATDQPPKIVVDLSGLSFVNSAGLGAFIALHQHCRQHGGDVCFVNPRPAVAQILRVTNLDRLIRTYPDLDSAIKALSS